ncbi:hypothetical protein JXJ21_19955 [candidate division KSB1 bacterium]|nr:hypothetical protein [candidate division KSB1 bacterium]
MTQKETDKTISIAIGLDIGAISVKLAVIVPEDIRDHINQLVDSKGSFYIADKIPRDFPTKNILMLSHYRRIHGAPIEVSLELLQEFHSSMPQSIAASICVTGSGAKKLSELLDADLVNEFKAIATGVGRFHPDVYSILELGGDSSKYIAIEVNPQREAVSIIDYGRNGDCAAGTGSFMDQQASRLLYDIEDVGEIVVAAGKSANIAGRCSVFAKSDMIHAQQKGYQPPEILKGLCEAVVRNFKGTIVKGKALGKHSVFIGGVAGNAGVVQAIRQMLNQDGDSLFVPAYHASMGAIGAALLAHSKPTDYFSERLKNAQIIQSNSDTSFPHHKPLTLEKTILLRDRVQQFSFEGKQLPVNAYLGIDIGSVSTKLVIIDSGGNLIKEIYTRTDARPVEVVKRGLKEIESELGNRVTICGVGTTGSGRELIGSLVGADTIKDEITAHKAGAMYISEKMIQQEVDTIFDIGGQDSKFISIQNGVVVDFTMNEACAAGTGSFLEEQAEKLGISIKQEFAELALSSSTPIRLGERCTVFMEKMLTPYLQQGVSKADLTAGLAYSIVLNYLNRVVRGRRIGDTIYFQGGTAYNDSVAAAFSTVLNKEVIVPPYNGVIGAIGAAILAMQKMEQRDRHSNFRGFDLNAVNYTIRNFVCRGCANHCDIQEVTVEDEKTYWGDKCSDRYRKKARVSRHAIIPDLIEFRENQLKQHSRFDGTGPVFGIPRSMYFYERLPFWSTYLSELGFKLVLSDITNKKILNDAVASAVAEPCFPIIVAHGHIQNLIDKNVEMIFQPNEINSETPTPSMESYLCPWGQTQPYVFAHVPAFQAYRDRYIAPTIHFMKGSDYVKRELRDHLKQFGISKKASDLAVDAAYQAQRTFRSALLEMGQQALNTIIESDEMAIVLIGRPYNLYDRAINLNVPTKLRQIYGVNVIPFDFLSTEHIGIDDINDSMYWNYGRKILQTAKYIKQHPNLHLIYITNFKCGPDSYVKHYVHEASGKPYIVLQFDGHGNDAGIMTRCEAYLDSKGFFKGE